MTLFCVPEKRTPISVHYRGIVLAIDEATGDVLYLAFFKHETTQAFVDAIATIVTAGYAIKGIIIDGKIVC